MALRNIIYSDNPMIRKRSRPVENFDENLWELLDDMRETMHQHDGVGIAGPQVGVLRQVVVIETEGTHLELINPKITKTSGSQESLEGCLSVKEYDGLVIRPKKVTVEFFDRFGSKIIITAEDYLATVFCHEIDHLSGILFVDKARELYKKNDTLAVKSKKGKN
jgi:peptide deformylase